MTRARGGVPGRAVDRRVSTEHQRNGDGIGEALEILPAIGPARWGGSAFIVLFVVLDCRAFWK